MNKEKINEAYEEVKEVYKHTKQAAIVLAIFTNVGVLCLSA